MTRVLFAPDGFKGSISAVAAAEALAAGWRAARPGDAIVELPMADGGEGTLDAFLVAVPGARRMPVAVTGPHGRAVAASWVLLPPTDDAPQGTGVVELASTSGIELLDGALRPFDADTRGFGQAIAAALDHGVSRLVLAIGSSASTDAGFGMLAALGARITDADHLDVVPGLRGVRTAARIDRGGVRSLPAGGALVLTDVRSPLTGPAGAAAVFGPQKGLGPADVADADAALARAAALLDTDAAHPGAGAAGGTGAALRAWGAELVPGAERIADLVGLAAAVAAADVVVTGEGSFDASSGAGKAPARVAALAQVEGRRVGLVAGRIAPEADTSAFGAAVALVALAGSTEAALADPARWLAAAGEELARRLG
ncbi:MAG: glycerate kinase [Microbacterium sp. 71-36]|uniref:glycerate kinase n=1 Tax=unclassified Microbacterium TaxID=2609290 RepID=UPI00092A519C|nr:MULTISPECIES: glycerate kinase [unclassified Microbacterium]MBN9211933.1 glycerate kinase [Microbacterium sp.]OJV78032.1 MAG: glycerate kinase [Microbacterium sp. 71-36]